MNNNKKKKNKQTPWFKVWDANRALFLALDDETAGKVFKLAVRYFGNNEIVDIDNRGIQNQLEKLAFAPLKDSCDASIKDYRQRCKKGEESANKRWHGDELKEIAEEDNFIEPL